MHVVTQQLFIFCAHVFCKILDGSSWFGKHAQKLDSTEHTEYYKPCMFIIYFSYTAPFSLQRHLICIYFRYARAEVIAGFVNGLFLVFIAFFILSEAVEVSKKSSSSIQIVHVQYLELLRHCFNRIGLIHIQFENPGHHTVCLGQE